MEADSDSHKPRSIKQLSRYGLSYTDIQNSPEPQKELPKKPRIRLSERTSTKVKRAKDRYGMTWKQLQN